METDIPTTQFPSAEDRTRLRRSIQKANYSKLTTEDRWRWHSYDYAWRRAFLGDFDAKSPIDPFGEWINLPLIKDAQKMFERLTHSQSRHFVQSANAADVRDNWPEIPWPKLTATERKLAESELDSMGARAKSAIASATVRSREAFRDHSRTNYKPTESEVAPKPVHERAAVSPERLAELNAKLGYTDSGTGAYYDPAFD